ncbi:MAG: HlyD family efflux transporter periplasmic adaptor subunit [Lachnospiraceae bacterium]|nr:HlyD family efflux transporter periplasmic adaptor subunit [Lachnospiraceae bacterium]
MPKNNLISVTNAYGGKVEEIFVSDGQKVKEGDVLLTMDTQTEEENMGFLDYELSLLMVQKDVYSALKAYHDKEKEAEGQEKPLAKEQTPSEKYGIDLSKYESNAPVAEALLAEEELYEIRLQEYDLSIKAGQNREVLQNQKESFVAERNLTIIQNLNSIAVKMEETEKEKRELLRTIEQKNIKAEADGVVTNLSVNTKGQLLGQGSQIAYIIPDGEETVFRAYVKSSDIEGIQAGENVRVRIAALNDTAYERLEGTVLMVGDAALNVDGLGSVYRVEVELKDIPEGILKTGEEGTCDILLGKRSVLDYFLEPFISGLQDSLHER